MGGVIQIAQEILVAEDPQVLMTRRESW